jgi:hypothetical protein
MKMNSKNKDLDAFLSRDLKNELIARSHFRTDHYTSPSRVGPSPAKIEREKGSETNFPDLALLSESAFKNDSPGPLDTSTLLTISQLESEIYISSPIQKSCVTEIEAEIETNQHEKTVIEHLSTGPTAASPSDPTPNSTWTALLTQSMSVLSGGSDLVSSDLLVPHDFSTRGSSPRGSPRVTDVNGRDYFPDAESAEKHCSTDPGVCVCHI